MKTGMGRAMRPAHAASDRRPGPTLGAPSDPGGPIVPLPAMWRPGPDLRPRAIPTGDDAVFGALRPGRAWADKK